MELRGSSHFMSVPCHQAAAECLYPWCGSQAGMRATVFADIWEGVYVLMPVWIHTHGGCEWSWFRPGLPAQFVRHWPPPEWSRSPTTGRMGWALQTALIHGQPKKKKKRKNENENENNSIQPGILQNLISCPHNLFFQFIPSQREALNLCISLYCICSFVNMNKHVNILNDTSAPQEGA